MTIRQLEFTPSVNVNGAIGDIFLATLGIVSIALGIHMRYPEDFDEKMFQNL